MTLNPFDGPDPEMVPVVIRTDLGQSFESRILRDWIELKGGSESSLAPQGQNALTQNPYVLKQLAENADIKVGMPVSGTIRVLEQTDIEMKPTGVLLISFREQSPSEERREVTS